jgi:predicted TIM-barrel fold metal-dependent hydrolase
MIFDCLTHVTPDGRWFNTSHDASIARLLRELETAKVDRAIVVALAGYIDNDFVLKVCQQYPDVLVPGMSFNPTNYPTDREAAHEFRSQLQGMPFKVLKLHPRLNRYDPLDPRCLAILEELASWRLNIPILIDSFFHYKGASLRKPIVDTICDLVGRFPEMKFVILHGGGPWILQIAEAIRDSTNAFIDISFTLHRYARSSVWMDIQYLLHRFDRRMVFGSDFPEIGIGKAIEDFTCIAGGISADKCANVLGKNLCGILGEG